MKIKSRISNIKAVSRHKHEEMEFFNKHIEEYIEGFTKFRWKSYKSYIAINFIKESQPLKILDIGSGPVPSLEVLIKSQNLYCCLDIAKANIKYLEKNYPNCHIKQGDAENLTKFYKNKFDLVIIFGLLHHLPNPEKTLDQVKRILKKEGILIASEPSNYWNGKMPSPNEKGFSSTDIKKLFDNFSEYQIKTFNFQFLEGNLWNFLNKIYKKNPFIGDKLWKLIFVIENLLNSFGIRGRDFLITAKP